MVSLKSISDTLFGQQEEIYSQSEVRAMLIYSMIIANPELAKEPDPEIFKDGHINMAELMVDRIMARDTNLLDALHESARNTIINSSPTQKPQSPSERALK